MRGGERYTHQNRLLEGTEALRLHVSLFCPSEVYGATREIYRGDIRLPKSIGVCVMRQRGGNGMIEMMICLLPLEMQVLTPFYWTERGFTQDDFEEGIFSIGSFLPFSLLCNSPLG